jgi:hypothetical protein
MQKIIMTRVVVNMEELNLVRKIISRNPYTSAADRFFGLPDPVPLVRGTDLDPSNHQAKIVSKTLIPTVFCDLFMTFYL